MLRFTICTLILVASLNNFRAQPYDWISNDFPDSRFLGVFEVNGKYYGAVSNGASSNYDPNTIYQLTIYELEFDQSGKPGITLNEIATMPFPENYATITLDYIEETDLWIIVQSAVLSNEKQRYRVILCNQNFEIISQQTLDTISYPIPFHIDSYNGKTYVLGSIFGETQNEIFFMEYFHSNPYYLPPIEVKQSEPRQTYAITSMKIDQRTGDMLVFYYGGITELDTNLHQDLRLGYNDINTAYFGNVIGNQNNYYSHSLTEQDFGNGFKLPIFQKYDTLFNILATDTLGTLGQDHYPFETKSLDYRNNEFLVGGHLDGPYAHLNFDRTIKKFYLAKFDEQMNRLWYKEYGGDRAYILIGLKLLDDGGSLAYGYVTDTLSGLWYAYILHVNANGEILTSSTTPLHPKISIQVVNPGDETLRILNPENIQASIELYDMQGCLVLKNKLHADASDIDTEELPVGLYPYLLIRDGHIISSGKWIKTN